MEDITIRKAEGDSDYEHVKAIRREVFVKGQNVPEDKLDEFEDESIHYLAFCEGKPVGTARWRMTNDGIKLERFAVLLTFRRKGIGSALLEHILSEIDLSQDIYLHAQEYIVPFYINYGFRTEGDIFDEAEIPHYKMIYE